MPRIAIDAIGAFAAVHESEIGRFCCRSRQRPRVGGPLVLSVGLDPPIPAAALRNFDATQCTTPEREAVVRPAPRTAASSERWRPEQTHPAHLAGRAVGADRASGSASSVRTASRSFCAHVVTAQSLRFQRTTAQRRGHARGYRAGSCVMVLLGSTAV